MSWDTYFMSVALLSSFRSKDKKTQTGSCITNWEKKIIWVWYNGLPRWLDDNNPIFWQDDDTSIIHSKHTYVIHAEQNAIHNSITHSLEWASLYVTLFPCKECAKSICQRWIKRVVYLNIKPHHEEENNAIHIMFKSAWVECIPFDSLNVEDKDFIKKLNELNKKMY